MENTVKWEYSRQKYVQLFECLNILMQETSKTLAHYEKVNMDFAYSLFNEHLIPVAEKDGHFEVYSDEFASIHKALRTQVNHLNEYRDKMQLLMLKDRRTCPPN